MTNKKIEYSEIVLNILKHSPTRWKEQICKEYVSAVLDNVKPKDFFNELITIVSELSKKIELHETLSLKLINLFLNTLKEVQNNLILKNSLLNKLDEMKQFEFPPDQIERLLTWDNHEPTIQNHKGTFYASSIEGKIYTGKDAYRKIYFKDQTNPSFPFNCLDLVPEYYELLEAAYIETKRKKGGAIFNEQAAKEKLRVEEIERTTEIINDAKSYLKSRTHKPKFKQNTIEIFEHYLQWLNDKQTNTQPNKEQAIKAPVNEAKHQISKTKEKIIEALSNIDKHESWSYAFRTIEDFNFFVQLLTDFFEVKQYTIPANKINLKKGCKTRFAQSLNDLHEYLDTTERPLKRDVDFFEILKCLNHFKDNSDAEIYKLITG
ncbi:MAG: hypothetical protein V9E96_01275 [Chitinophagaceae bacterium]|nr:hypothetical protein [Chitinophagaceae bacterium]MBP9739524.1 hypothetical protein [Chitinophagaceae bacterium]